MVVKNDPYETLGVEKDASSKEIKERYKKLAKEKHPDKGGNHEEFTDITVAFDILSDPKKRKFYDETGSASNASTREDKARALIVEQFLEILGKTMARENELCTNLAKVVRENLNSVKSKLMGDIKSHKKIVTRLNKVKKKLKKKKKRKKKEPNFYELAVEGQIAIYKNQIPEFEAKLDILKRAIEMSKDYDYDADEAELKDVKLYFDLGRSDSQTATFQWGP